MAAVKVLVLLGLATLTTANNIISSPPITDWGEWGNHERCPWGRYAQGFQLKTEPNQYFGDDTALNAIRLFCGDPFKPDTAVITSTVGDFGSWGQVYTCYPGVLTGFQLRVESDRGSGDDTATNNARFTCTDSPKSFIEGDGMTWGDWSSPQSCNSSQAICGIQTQVEPYQEGGDDTMLNNVRLECCAYNNKDLQSGYDYVKEHGAYPKALSPEFATLLRKAVADELNGGVNSDAQADKLNVAHLISGRAGNKQAAVSTGQLLKQISETVQNDQFQKSHKKAE